MAPYIPPEIVILIVSNIDQLRDRLQFLRVCKLWHKLLRPTVFASIVIDNPCFLSRLVSVVHRDSQLANAICAIDCHLYEDITSGGTPNPHVRAVFKEAFDPFLLEDSLVYLSQTPCDWPELERRITSGHEDAWLSLLLLKLQNLRTLCLTVDRFSHISILAERITHPDDSDDIVALNRLESLQIGNKESSPFQDCHAYSLAPFFLLPSMRVFRGFKIHQELASSTSTPYDFWECDGACTSYETEELPEKSSSVREIILEESNCEFGFKEFIAACECLERFEYQHSNEAWYHKTYMNFRPRAFYEPLRLHSRTLQRLRLNDMGVASRLPKGEYDHDGKRPRETIETWFGSLLEFTALKEVRMPLQTLVGDRKNRQSLDDVLPRSLEVLCVAQVDRKDYNFLARELKTLLVGGEFPSLQEVVVCLYQVELLEGEAVGVPLSAMKAFKKTTNVYDENSVSFMLSCDGDHEIVRGREVIHKSASIEKISDEYRARIASPD